MSTPSKIGAPSPAASARGQLFRVAIVGAATLKGKEVAEMLNERNFPAAVVRLLDDDESIGQLEATGDEINFIQSVRAEQFTHVDFTFFAADKECTRQNWKRARDAGSAIIDLSGALEEEAGANVRSLWIERERGEMWQPELQPAPCIVAHPAAVTLALLLLRARKAGAVHGAAATVFLPVSEQGQKGMDELHQQTVNLLSFQSLPKDIFDVQLAFNMVARYGQKSRLSLESLEARVRRDYLEIAGADALQPAMMLLQPPVFHGLTLAIFLEMEQAVDQERLSQALAGDHVVLAGAEEDSQPSNVNTAGQANILVSLTRDAARPNGIWLWAAADNLRIAAMAAVECAESMIPTRPLGKIQ
ncbi:MAG TPA: Asd/ArgC dimerization domain-containing protein [Candidatus Sulfotelmatobacter sp.]|jgi:aspartate-semialdehyde dehydrogenase|nr:Asd/ArgC dimerization domain-containing protein [Candidatus Sulfotelmatobacter sp.]